MQDPSTGIQPFLPLQTGPSSPVALVLMPLAIVFGLVRALLLAVLLVIYFLLVEIILQPLGALGLPLASLFTAVLARLALGALGYYWIPTELASAKRMKQGISQTVPSSARKGDLIICNWTSYIDVLYLAFRCATPFASCALTWQS